MRRRSAVFVAVAGVGLALAGTYGYRWYYVNRQSYHGYARTSFSVEEWASADGEQRGYMAEDLLETHDLIGMTADEVVELLGKPDRDIIGATIVDTRLYEYDIGYMGYNKKAPGAMRCCLIIGLSRDKIVTRAYLDN
ncbi:MAG: hypothetical protein E4H02_06750 [Lentisphaerales bacterium]|jgi:hypothetical protein|nr:MAG: hypothetical protein E4H02_06750 [Lentisphaerales bacterium]